MRLGYLLFSLVGASGSMVSAGNLPSEPSPNGIVCIREIEAAGAEAYNENRHAFARWLQEQPYSFYIADALIAPVEPGASTFQYRLGISVRDHEQRIGQFARQFDPQLNVSTTGVERPLFLEAPDLRWADWFPSRASIGYLLPDRLGEFAKVLLRGIDGILYVETEHHYKIQIFARPDRASDPGFVQQVAQKLAGLPGTLTIRSDVFNSRIHQTLIERTTASVLHAIRTQPDELIDIAIEPYPGEAAFIQSLTAIMKLPGVSFYAPSSTQHALLEHKCGRCIFGSVRASVIPDFVEYFSIRKILLAPQDCDNPQR